MPVKERSPGRKFDLQACSGISVTNPGYEDFESEKPMQLKGMMTHEQDGTVLSFTPTHDDNQNETITWGKEQNTQGQYCVQTTLLVIVFLMSLAALILILLMLFGKICDKCDCSAGSLQAKGQ